MVLLSFQWVLRLQCSALVSKVCFCLPHCLRDAHVSTLCAQFKCNNKLKEVVGRLWFLVLKWWRENG
jgi:hypothetical protein